MSYYEWNWPKSLCAVGGWVWWVGGVGVVCKPIIVFSLVQAEQFTLLLEAVDALLEELLVWASHPIAISSDNRLCTLEQRCACCSFQTL